MAQPISARIQITPQEWAQTRMRAIAEGVSTAEHLARLVRKDLAESNGSAASSPEKRSRAAKRKGV